MNAIAIVKPVFKQSGVPKEILEESTSPYVPGFKAGTQNIITGITFDEQKKYLPQFVGVSSTSPDFQEKVRDFYIDYTRNIPFNGIEVETGKLEDGTPINIEDYIFVKLLEEDSNVAKTKDELESRDFYNYTLEYKDAIAKEEESNYILNKEANLEFIKLTADIDPISKLKVKYIVLIEKIFFGESILSLEKLTDLQLEVNLKKLVDKKPDAFLKLVKSDSLEYLAFIKSCLEFNLLAESGQAIYYKDEKLADRIGQCANVLKKDSGLYSKLQSELKEIKKNNTI